MAAPSAKRSRQFWLLVAFAGFVLAGVAGAALWPHRTLEQPSVLGGPLRYTDAGADRVYLLTQQWESRRSAIYGRSSTSYRQESRLHLDLWVFDPATAQPLRRHRLHSEQSSVQAAPLGIDQGVLWLRGPELMGIRLSDGAVVADNARIAARNPTLRGLLPLPPPTTFLTEAMQPLKFENGLVVTLSDARRVRIDPMSLEATLLEAAAPRSAATAPSPRSAVAAAASSGAESLAVTRAKVVNMGELSLRDFLVKSVVVGNSWMGLMDQNDLKALRERRAYAVSPPRGPPQPQRFYRAGLQQEKGFLGLDLQLVDPVPLPDAPEFLTAGLLVGETPRQALWQREPDSVFALHRDRLGSGGKLQISRVALRSGKVVWQAALPLAQMHAWMPGAQHVVAMGPDAVALHSASREEAEAAAMQLVSVALASGALQTFNLDRNRDWQPAGVANP